MNAREVWKSDRAHLQKEMNAEITERKIRKISFIQDGKLFSAEVGKTNPYNGIPVRVIYEDKRGWICCGTVTIAQKDSLVEEY